MTFSIRTEGLTKRYGSVRALVGLDLEVPKGAVFALIGTNGAGKTTAIKTLLNIATPTGGRAEVLGWDSRRLRPQHFTRIGYVSENQELPEWMSVRRFLEYMKQFYPAWNDEDAGALVNLFELPLDRPLGALSRGMRVKAALASSLPYRPKLIVLDEPFSGLDGLVREQVIESILERIDDATVLVASHDLAEIENCASHIGYLHDGQLQFTEEMASLSSRFREIEITLESPSELPADVPQDWLNLSSTGLVVRFVNSRFDAKRTANEIRARMPAVRDVAIRPMPLRAIFVTLARAQQGRRVS